MLTEFTAIIKNEGAWWIGWIEEIPGANAQERTRDELIISLKEVTKDILEINRLTAKESAQEEYEEISLAI
ncbi:MAG: type II toxin-antitoxin system HicB family antitoxin [Spirochaetes bacterium]|nr:MAG: type II toxin-antitoxin system HicB family antitoxin [Spirochaetota bacterium]